MVRLASTSAAACLTAIAALAAAHSEPRSEAEIAARNLFQRNARRSLSECSGQLSKRGSVYDQSIERRRAYVESIRKSRGIDTNAPYLNKRDLSTVIATSHKSNLTGVTNNTETSQLFSSNASCILGPEVTEGPYQVAGEYVRYDLRESQEGVPLYLDVELIDVSTCKPVPDTYIEFWHANATGVYSGVVANGNGQSSDASNINTTFARGFQKTNSSGVAQFLTIFPGHYTGRASHIHVMAMSANGTLNKNGTYSADTVTHVGQVFFDQDLISSVESVSPYSTNTQSITQNSDDSIMSGEAGTIDPVMEYVLLGSSVDQGVFGWISFGINTSAAHTVNDAATLTSNGGVANANSGGMGGGPGGSPPGANSSASGSTSTGDAASSSFVRFETVVSGLLAMMLAEVVVFFS